MSEKRSGSMKKSFGIIFVCYAFAILGLGLWLYSWSENLTKKFIVWGAQVFRVLRCLVISFLTVAIYLFAELKSTIKKSVSNGKSIDPSNVFEKTNEQSTEPSQLFYYL
jgi:hypothetical protein